MNNNNLRTFNQKGTPNITWKNPLHEGKKSEKISFTLIKWGYNN